MSKTIVRGKKEQKPDDIEMVESPKNSRLSRKRMRKDLLPGDRANSGKGQFLVYEAEDGRVKIDVRLEEETVWLTQQLMADLFQTTKQNISLHIQSIYDERELTPEATVKKYLSVRREGNSLVPSTGQGTVSP